MTIRSAVDKNSILLSALSRKPKAKPSVTLSSDIPDLLQVTADAKEDEQAISIKDPVISKQKLNDSVFEPIKFDVNAALDDTAEVTINKSVVSELFPDHSPSSIDESDVSIDTVSFPDTIEGCVEVIPKLRNRTLNTANDNLATALVNTMVVNTQLLTVRQKLDFAGTSDLSEMACSTFASKQLEDAIQHVRTFRLWVLRNCLLEPLLFMA